MVTMTCAAATKLALTEEMRRDATVWVLGEDLGPEGGVAGQYRGMQAEFGRDRIFDTPISENSIMGAGVGAAMSGTRPVVELRYCDLAVCAADEIINQAAKMRYMTGGQCKVPLVIRLSIGMRGGSAAHHSQSLESMWINIPGLVVIAPSSADDCRKLLKAAIRNDDPVIFLEHKTLFFSDGEVDERDESLAEIGKANVLRPGSDVTIVAWSIAVDRAMAAADALASQGISAEVIDLRTLWPWDKEAVFASVRKTGLLMVAHESVEEGGFGGEVVAEVTKACFGDLRAAPVRVACPRVTVPYAQSLEQYLFVTPERIVESATKLTDSARQSH
ncbi:MAG: alpha-ketoacid dehydrogenase subunit beta [Novosphingobium sp.]